MARLGLAIHEFAGKSRISPPQKLVDASAEHWHDEPGVSSAPGELG
jgi:hypothetical protein